MTHHVRRAIKENRSLLVYFLLGAVVAAIMYYGYGQLVKEGRRGGTTEPKNLAILNFPSEDATEAEKKSHYDYALGLAVKTDSISVSHCIADPIVVESKQQDLKLKIRNADELPISIFFADKKSDIPAMSIQTVEFQLSKGGGVYGYGCSIAEEQPINSGLIILTP